VNVLKSIINIKIAVYRIDKFNICGNTIHRVTLHVVIELGILLCNLRVLICGNTVYDGVHIFSYLLNSQRQSSRFPIP